MVKDPNLIHKDLYPGESMLSSIEIKDTTYLAYQAKFENIIILKLILSYVFRANFLFKRKINKFFGG